MGGVALATGDAALLLRLPISISGLGLSRLPVALRLLPTATDLRPAGHQPRRLASSSLAFSSLASSSLASSSLAFSSLASSSRLVLSQGHFLSIWEPYDSVHKKRSASFTSAVQLREAHHRCIHTCMRTYACAHMHTRMHAYTHAYARAYTHAYMHVEFREAHHGARLSP